MIRLSDRDCAFMAKYHMTASDIWLWKYIWNKGRNKGAIFIDLRDFNKRYQQLAFEQFSRRHLVRLLEKLERLGLVEIVRQGFWYSFKVIVYPISTLYAPECSSVTSAPKEEKPETQERKEQKVEHAFLQQQHKEVSELLQSEGFNYQERDIPEIAKFGIEIIKKSIRLYKLRSLTSNIFNKEGWLKRCLKCGWWRNLPDPEEQKGIWDRAVDDFRVLARQLKVKFGALPNLDYDLKPYPAVDWGSQMVLNPT